MRLTKERLKQIIKEELQAVLKENYDLSFFPRKADKSIDAKLAFQKYTRGKESAEAKYGTSDSFKRDFAPVLSFILRYLNANIEKLDQIKEYDDLMNFLYDMADAANSPKVNVAKVASTLSRSIENSWPDEY